MGRHHISCGLLFFIMALLHDDFNVLPGAVARAMTPLTRERDNFQQVVEEKKLEHLEVHKGSKFFRLQSWLKSPSFGHMDMPLQMSSVVPKTIIDSSHSLQGVEKSHEAPELLDFLEGSNASPQTIQRRWLAYTAMDIKDDYEDPGANRNPGNIPYNFPPTPAPPIIP